VNVRAQSAASAIAAKPPFRAEHIGSLLRPAKLLRERARFAKGEINAAELAAAEDDAIAEAIRLQERLGFKFVTDGEFRRRSYHSFFYGALGHAVGADGQSGRLRLSAVQWTHPINSADAAFLKTNRIAGRRSRFQGPARCTSAAVMPR